MCVCVCVVCVCIVCVCMYCVCMYCVCVVYVLCVCVVCCVLCVVCFVCVCVSATLAYIDDPAGVFQQQLVHVRNGCISDDPNHLPYVRVGAINFHHTGHILDHYQSLRGTSKVEAVHSVLDRTFYGTRGICTEVFDARLGWWLVGYNHRRLRTLGEKVPPDALPPKVLLIPYQIWTLWGNVFAC